MPQIPQSKHQWQCGPSWEGHILYHIEQHGESYRDQTPPHQWVEKVYQCHWLLLMGQCASDSVACTCNQYFDPT